MKILHTADWHAGRNLKGVNRTPEIREALREIAALAVDERVDLILVSGDLYDKKNPLPDAEEAVYEFFLTTGGAGIPSIVIAGNHDSPIRLDAAGGLLKLVNAQVFGEAKVARDGGAFTLRVGDEVAQVAALPFVSERRIVRYAQLMEQDPGEWREKYREGMRKLITNLTAGFSSDAVNLLMLHTTMEGATLSHSEYKFHCTQDYTLAPDALPLSANYVALGHIHKAQAVENYPAHAARYCGSIVQLDFGEAGDKKYVSIIEAQAGKPSVIREVALSSGKPLKGVKIDLEKENLESRLESIRDFPGWLKLSLKMNAPKPGLKDKIMADLKNIVTIEFDFPRAEMPEGENAGVDLGSMQLLEAYQQFNLDTKGLEVDPKVLNALREMLEKSSESTLELA